MAHMNYRQAPDGCTAGERVVFNVLKESLADDFFVWFEPTLYGKRMSARPDFVVLGRQTGLVILEVKDWSTRGIRSANRDTFEIEQDDQLQTRTNPEKQVAGHKYALLDEIERYRLTEPERYRLLLQTKGAYQGKLAVPVSTLIVFPNITRSQWAASPLGLPHMLNSAQVLLQDDLRTGVTERLLAVPVFKANLTDEQLAALKWMIYPEVRVPYTQQSLLDLDQMSIARADTYLPLEGEALVRKTQIKLVRGAVGSGKSLILLHRAKLISEQNANWRVLVLTYNKSLMQYLEMVFREMGGRPEQATIANFHKWCYDLLKASGQSVRPLDEFRRLSVIQKVLNAAAGVDFSVEFLAEEFNWIKERLNYQTWADYVDPSKVKRTGRGRGLGGDEALKRQVIFDLFLKYEERLGQLQTCDWADVPVKTLAAIDSGAIAAGQCHAVLVDEAQDFSPAWFRVVFQMLSPSTRMLFIVGDGAQRIYRQDFTWKELGLAVTAHNSYVLTRSYRSTREIVDLAFDLIQDSETIQAELRSAGDALITPEQSYADFRHGPVPVLLGFTNAAGEYAEVAKTIQALVREGFAPQQIAILQRSQARTNTTVRELERHGVKSQHYRSGADLTDSSVKICTLHSAKGLEFEVVFICGLEEVGLEGKAAPDDLAAQMDYERKLLYVGMTRARKRLYLTYSGTGPDWILKRLQSRLEKLRNQ